MSVRLKTVSISNFRAIQGNITLELDAPVVLIHGQNGIGKTSVLSAIELGLTGAVPSLERLDRNYASHLVHMDAPEAEVRVGADLIEGVDEPGEMIVRDGRISGQALLPRSAAQFYSERCYLAQSTLSRLLEIYEHKDATQTDSPLTLFVKDLLGLDKLDDLIEGLHPAGDKRRVKSVVPLYREIENEISELERKIVEMTKERGALEGQINEIETRLSKHLKNLEIEDKPVSSALVRLLEGQPEEPQLQRIAGLRRDIDASLEQWQQIKSSLKHGSYDAAEAALATANRDVEMWRNERGLDLYGLLDSVAKSFASLTPVSTIGPQHACQEAIEAVSKDLERSAALLERDAEDTMRRSAIERNIVEARARADVLDDQIKELASNTGAVAQVLASVLSHIHSENCPVCDRDFGETSREPLRVHVSSKISSLTETAGRLQALTKERADASRALSLAETERASIAGRELTPERRTELKTRVARLQEFSLALTSLKETAAQGQIVLDAANAASQHLSTVRSGDQAASSLRATLSRFADVLGSPPAKDSEGVEAALERFKAAVIEREGTLISRQAARRTALADAREREKLVQSRQNLDEVLENRRRRLNRITNALTGAEARIIQARDLSHRARQARTAIVRRVFNDSLNAIWRELFVRLAPDEPFVPAFALPETRGGPVEAVLETLHRDGGKSGSPRAILSAGNLNTAALTLFLSLHLSVSPTLPWLVVDDPIQSMDEVHIAQFAALLRTLSKQHNRQVIIAVHEKPLFDYLSLELSPAFPDDRLITIELGRASDGATVFDYQPLVWRPDTSIAA